MPESPGDTAAELRAVNARLRGLLAERDAEVAGLRELVVGLQAQVADLAAKSGQNSGNSSKPPSSDGLAKPGPKSLRAGSGRKPGRPKGQPGATMQLSGSPDATASDGSTRSPAPPQAVPGSLKPDRSAPHRSAGSPGNNGDPSRGQTARQEAA